MSLKDELQKVMRGEVDDTPAALEAYSRDASLFMVRPQVITHPSDADDICAAVRFVSERKKTGDKNISLTARSAGTDMSGGPLNDSIILDITAHLNRLIEVKDNHAVVEPGMYF